MAAAAAGSSGSSREQTLARAPSAAAANGDRGLVPYSGHRAGTPGSRGCFATGEEHSLCPTTGRHTAPYGSCSHRQPNVCSSARRLIPSMLFGGGLAAVATASFVASELFHSDLQQARGYHGYVSETPRRSGQRHARVDRPGAAGSRHWSREACSAASPRPRSKPPGSSRCSGRASRPTSSPASGSWTSIGPSSSVASRGAVPPAGRAERRPAPVRHRRRVPARVPARRHLRAGECGRARPAGFASLRPVSRCGSRRPRRCTQRLGQEPLGLNNTGQTVTASAA
jgi:hypothetical protein